MSTTMSTGATAQHFGKFNIAQSGENATCRHASWTQDYSILLSIMS